LNLWCTMIGGGTLSLPLAFSKTGNVFLGPLLLLFVACITHFCFGLLIDCTYYCRIEPTATTTITTSRYVSSSSSSPSSHQSNSNNDHENDAQVMPLLPTELDSSNANNGATTAADATDDNADTVSTVVGTTTLEQITAVAFRSRSSSSNTTTYFLSSLLVLCMCWFAIIGYCVLLRDMLLPVSQYVQHEYNNHHSHHYRPPTDSMVDDSTMPSMVPTATTTATTTTTTVTWANNLSMILVVLIITPLCTLPTLTSLQRFSTLSMLSILILGLCIVYRSGQCHLGYYHRNDSQSSSNSTTTTTTSHIRHDTTRVVTQDWLQRHLNVADEPIIHDDDDNNHRYHHWTDGFNVFPRSMKDVLDVIPLFISCFVCHYNIPIVHNDFAHPTPERLRQWFTITIVGATLFYGIVGIAGSSFATMCGSTTRIVQGNVLLNFDPTDPLLLVGRLCLAITIALALPVLTIPARDIVLRYLQQQQQQQSSLSSLSALSMTSSTVRSNALSDNNNDLTEPLLQSSVVDNNEDIEGVDDEETIHASNVEQSDATTNTNDFLVGPNTHTNLVSNIATVMNGTSTNQDVSSSSSTSSFLQRLLLSICILWSGTAIASTVSSIAVVWDLLGSSLSIILSYLIPAGCYLQLHRRHHTNNNDNSNSDNSRTVSGNDTIPDHDSKMVVREFKASSWIWLPSIATLCWMIVFFCIPLMFLSTINAIYNLWPSKE
jgi:amino acid permease